MTAGGLTVCFPTAPGKCYYSQSTSTPPQLLGYCNSITPIVNGTYTGDEPGGLMLDNSPEKVTGNIPEVKAGECLGVLTTSATGVQTVYKYPCSNTTTEKITESTTSSGSTTLTTTVTQSTSCDSAGTCTQTETKTVTSGGASSTTSSLLQNLSKSGLDQPQTTDICTTNPNRLECATMDVPPTDEKLDKVSKAATYAEIAFSSANVSACPGGFSFAVAGKTYQVSTQPICDALGYLRVIVLALAAMMAASIITGGFKV